MTPPRFCCDIYSGTTEEQNEFKRLFRIASKHPWRLMFRYYGFSSDIVGWHYAKTLIGARKHFNWIIPLSEGIDILKLVVGEEQSKIPDSSVIKSRIIDAVNKSLKYTDGQISGIDMNQLEERVDGILNSLQPKP